MILSGFACPGRISNRSVCIPLTATLTMSSTFMIETPFMSSGLKSPKSSVCVAGGASSNTFTLVFFTCTRTDSVYAFTPALSAQYPAQIDFNLASDVFEASSSVVNIDLTHDAGVVDQNIELGKLFGDLFVKSGDRFRIGHVASKGVNLWKGRFRSVHLRLIAARDNNRVPKSPQFFVDFLTN